MAFFDYLIFWWALPGMLFVEPVDFIVNVLCFCGFCFLISRLYHDLERRYGMLLALFAGVAVLTTPVLWFAYWFIFPVRESREIQRQLEASARRQRRSDAVEEATPVIAEEQRSFNEARDTTHFERDLLAGKSRAAIGAHLEREIHKLPHKTIDIGLPAFEEGLMYQAITEDLPETSPMESHPLARQEATVPPPPWETLGLKTPEEEAAFFEGGEEAAEPDHLYKPAPPPLFTPPRIQGCHEPIADQLYKAGRFDEAVLFLEHQVALRQGGGREADALQDYLRICRAQQLQRELDKYRAEFDAESLMG